MNDPKQPNQEPRRVSQPNPQPSQTPPMEAPTGPQTEYEKEVPHAPSQPVAQTGKAGEGSYEGTEQYRQGFEKFAQGSSPDQSMKRAEQIDVNDPQLEDARKRTKDGLADRASAPSIH